jgi:hypothetical protein
MFVVGARSSDGNGENSGQVSVYKFNPFNFSYGKFGLDINGEAGFDQFGYSVSITADGSTFIVGAPSNDGNGINAGHVRVYKFNSSNNSYVKFGLDIDGEVSSDQFGFSVSIAANGLTFIVGAPLNDGNGNSAGHVRVFRFNSTVNRYDKFGLDIDGEAAGDQFGWSVSIAADGLTFIVGAPSNDGNGLSAGHVRVYKFISSNNSYEKFGPDIDEEAAGDQFGWSVSIAADGLTFIVGAPSNDGNGLSAGHVRVYKFNSSNNSYEKFGPDIDGEAAGDGFGSSVSIGANGLTFVAGASSNDGNGGNSGHVRVYKFNSSINSYEKFGPDIDGETAGDLL